MVCWCFLCVRVAKVCVAGVGGLCLQLFVVPGLAITLPMIRFEVVRCGVVWCVCPLWAGGVWANA